MSTEEEKRDLKKKKKIIGDNLENLREFSLEDKKNRNFQVSKKYLAMFEKNYKFSDVAKIISKPETQVKKLRLDCLEILKEIIKERRLHLLVN
jgi:hypothetical protein